MRFGRARPARARRGGRKAFRGGRRSPPRCVRRRPCRPCPDAHQEPRRTPKRPHRGCGASARRAGARGAGAGLETGPERVRGRDGDQREDDDDRVDWPTSIVRRGCRFAVVGNVGIAASSLIGTLSESATVICEASSFQLEDTEYFAPEVAVTAQTSSPTIWTVTPRSRTTWPPSCGSSPTRATTTSPWLRTSLRSRIWAAVREG